MSAFERIAMQKQQRKQHQRRKSVSFSEAREVIEQFERDLLSVGISIKPGSELESICLYIMDLDSQRKGESAVEMTSDIRPMWQRAVGLISLLDMLNHARRNNYLSVFAPHLCLLNEGTAPQNVHTTLSDIACNKIFEMLIALFCMPVAEHVKLDDPRKSKGNNPDVLATINGTVWGFACKTPQGTSSKSMFDRLEEGVEQIENSPAEKGLVYFNFRNLIDHNRVWPEVQRNSPHEKFRFVVWQNSESVNTYFRQLVDVKNREMLEAIGVSNVQSIFTRKKSLPGAMVFMQSAAAFEDDHGHTVMSISFPALMELGVIPEADVNVMQKLLRAAYGQ
jgi:hypothetical protein